MAENLARTSQPSQLAGNQVITADQANAYLEMAEITPSKGNILDWNTAKDYGVLVAAKSDITKNPVIVMDGFCQSVGRFNITTAGLNNFKIFTEYTEEDNTEDNMVTAMLYGTIVIFLGVDYNSSGALNYKEENVKNYNITIWPNLTLNSKYKWTINTDSDANYLTISNPDSSVFLTERLAYTPTLDGDADTPIPANATGTVETDTITVKNTFNKTNYKCDWSLGQNNFLYGELHIFIDIVFRLTFYVTVGTINPTISVITIGDSTITPESTSQTSKINFLFHLSDLYKYAVKNGNRNGVSNGRTKLVVTETTTRNVLITMSSPTTGITCRAQQITNMPVSSTGNYTYNIGATFNNGGDVISQFLIQSNIWLTSN